MSRSTGKTTVLSSLAFATSPKELEYLMDVPRFMARNPDVRVPYGTTACEAVHTELVGMFDHITQQTAARAKLAARMFTLRKLVWGSMQRPQLTLKMTQSFMLRRCCDYLESAELVWGHDDSVVVNPAAPVDIANLDADAKLSSRHKKKRRTGA